METIPDIIVKFCKVRPIPLPAVCALFPEDDPSALCDIVNELIRDGRCELTHLWNLKVSDQ